MIRTIIFDLDGLLADTESNWYRVVRSMVEEVGGQLPLEDYVQYHMGKTVEDNVKLIIEKFNAAFSVEEGMEMMISRGAGFVEEGIALRPGAVELLDYLKNHQYKMVVGTSSVRERALKILTFNNIDHYFDDIVVGYEVERSKPFPDVFLAAAAKVNAKAEECLVLEDSEAGIQAAYAAKMKVICIPDLKEPGEDMAWKTTKILPSLSDVIEFLEEQPSY